MKFSFFSKFLFSFLFIFLPFFAHADITTGLVGHWALEEGSGSSAADSSGGSNTGTLTNSPSWVSGNIGSGAISLDGVDDYVNVPDDSSLDLTSFTIAGWINPSANTNNWKPIFTKENNSGGSRNYGLYIEGVMSNPHFHYSFQDASCSSYLSYNSNAVATLNTWQHVVMTYDGSSFKFYVDGVLDSSQSVSGDPCQSTSPFRITETGTSYDSFSGKVDDVRIYNRALSGSDVTELYSYTGSASGSDLTGYAWSDNIGWISFSCENTSSCASVDYGVTKDASGYLTGYAWSDNIGWVQFGGLSSFPTGAATFSQNAQVVGSDLRGWAQALSGDGNGWDGWISLAGTGYGVTKSGTSYSGYAWGDEVVGWLSFDLDEVAPTGSAALDVKSGGVSLSGDNSVAYGTIPSFEWTVTNAPSISCSITKSSVGGTAFAAINNITASGSVTRSTLVNGTYTYSIDCTDPTISQQITFTVLPEPSSFSLGGSESIYIQFLTNGSADSESKFIYVTPAGGFSNPVTISITSYPISSEGAVFTYSLGGSPFSASPAPVVILSPYSGAVVLKVHSSKKITLDNTITLTATASGAPDDTKDVVLTPTVFDPKFIEN